MYSRVNSNLLEDRLDAEFYSLEQIKNHKTLQDYGVIPLSAYCNGINVGYTGELTSVYRAQGTTLFRVSDIDGIFLSNDDVNYVPDDFAANNPQIWIRDNDIVFAAVGNTIGKVALKTVSMPDGVCSRALMIARPLTDKIDSSFLIAYLATKYAQKSLLRGVSGSAQPVLNTPLIANLPVISAESVSQKYIGDKVRQAEQLRVWAKRLYRIPAFIDAFIQGALPLSLTDLLFSLIKKSNNDAIKELTKFLALNIEGAQMKQNFQGFIEKNKMGSVDIEREFFHINTVSTSAIEDFLSAQTYRPAITDAFDKITSKKFSTLQSISLEPIRQGATPKFSAIGKKCIKSKQTRDLFLDETGYEIVDPNDEQNKRIVRLKRNDILVTRQGAGTVGRASIFLDDEETYITDSLFLVRIDPAKANPAFVAGFLRSYTGQRLIEKGVYGSTGQLNLSSTALRNIPILDVPLEFQNFLGETLCTADTLFKLSTRLTQSAKTLVEALIEGQLTEQQLIQAQQALEDGDNSLDQAILSKLSAEGYAIEGATPLFSDVDELYSLLEEAAQAEAEE
ncbi:restriction endonuclease subunit S [Escherichia coli]|nr:restriction endonuclease subunit S [Escherichia coli]MCI3680906.1 restriction endonuclease subunit S [Escherichia coli]